MTRVVMVMFGRMLSLRVIDLLDDPPHAIYRDDHGGEQDEKAAISVPASIREGKCEYAANRHYDRSDHIPEQVDAEAYVPMSPTLPEPVKGKANRAEYKRGNHLARSGIIGRLNGQTDSHKKHRH